MDSKFVEMTLVGSILINPACLPDVREKIRPEMFADEDCRAVYAAACSLMDQGRPVDPVTVSGQVPELPKSVLLEAMDLTPTAANANAYAEELVKSWLRLRAYETIRDAEANLLTEQDPLTVIAEALQRLEQLTAGEETAGLRTTAQVAASLFDRWEQAESGERFVLPLGYPRLDKLLGGGMVRGGLYFLAARTGNGKSTFALNVTERMLAAGKKVLFVTLEMTGEELEARRLAMSDGRHTAISILSGDLLSLDYDDLIPKLMELSRRPLVYLDRPRARVDDVVFFARRSKADVVVIDYLGLIAHKSGRTPYEQVSGTTNELKRAARALKIPILCLAQLNRAPEGRTNQKPRLSDLRDSGSIEQDGDGVLLLHKIDKGESTDDRLSPLDLIVAKNRHGGTGIARFSWALRNGRIVPEVGEG